MTEKKTKIVFTVNVRLEQVNNNEAPETMAYVFDSTGNFIASGAMPKGEKGQVKLELPSELAGSTVRIIVGPHQTEEREEAPAWMNKLIRREEIEKEGKSLAGLIRQGGYEKRVRLTAEASIIEVVVYPPDWKKWLLCRCVVRGRLVKRVPMADGTTKELGVSHACVKIYEVDKIPRIILRLPEQELYRLRDDLLKIFQRPLPEPPERIPLPLPTTKKAAIQAGNALYSADQLQNEMAPVFRASSVSQLRNALAAKADTLAIYICYFKWIWYWLHKDFIKCCCTDEQGRFETTIWYRCSGDKPDLYFRAIQCIGGSPHVIYDPGVACHTHWNYVCGTEVVLETDDPAAITCVPPDPIEPPAGVFRWVMPWGIGGLRLDQIKTGGLTDFVDDNGTWVNAPFGGSLGFRLAYSSGIPYDVANRPAYYRWLYNKLDSADHETEWREFAAPVADTVVRHYVDYDQAHPELPPTFPVYPLGPQEQKNMHLYEFKPHQPPKLTGHTREWPVDDWFADIYSGILQSVNLPGGVENAAGKYKIRLEVYDSDINLIIPGAGTFNFIAPVGLADDGVTIITRHADAGEIEDNGFIFYLHVDNNRCEAELYEASVNGVAAGPCGFISYGAGDDVTLSFKARHANDFARFKFTVVKGSSGYVTPACAPADPDVVWANAPLVSDNPNGFNRDAASVFTKNVDETDMRGACAKAAFGENLYVAATATNGWVRLSGLDASALPKAFALEPKTT
jgi:hypothetical protein